MKQRNDYDEFDVPFESPGSYHPLLSPHRSDRYFSERRSSFGRRLYFFSSRYIWLLAVGILFLSACALLIAGLAAIAATSTATSSRADPKVARAASATSKVNTNHGLILSALSKRPPSGPEGIVARSNRRRKPPSRLIRIKQKLLSTQAHVTKNWWIQNQKHLADLAAKRSSMLVSHHPYKVVMPPMPGANKQSHDHGTANGSSLLPRRKLARRAVLLQRNRQNAVAKAAATTTAPSRVKTMVEPTKQPAKAIKPRRKAPSRRALLLRRKLRKEKMMKLTATTTKTQEKKHQG